MDTACTLCPRNCAALRGDETAAGFCQSPLLPTVARAALHFGEEPCIGGERGAGAIFFTGCNLRCVFCQNREISRRGDGKSLGVYELCDIMLRLQDEGAACIDLVTGSHYIPSIAAALKLARLKIPAVWNSSGYEKAESLKLLEGLIQVYMPDFKYWRGEAAQRYSAARDYPETAAAAIKEMYRQTGPYVMDEDGLLRSGVLIRHLILPGMEEDARDIIDFAADEFPRGSVLFSLMSQYTPIEGLDAYPELCQAVDSDSNEQLIHYMKVRHLDGYWQELSSATEEMLPLFDGTGLTD